MAAFSEDAREAVQRTALRGVLMDLFRKSDAAEVACRIVRGVVHRGQILNKQFEMEMVYLRNLYNIAALVTLATDSADAPGPQANPKQAVPTLPLEEPGNFNFLRGTHNQL